MTNVSKSILASKVFWGALMQLVAFAMVSLFGVEITMSEQSSIVEQITEIVALAAGLGGAALTIYGRIKARQPVTVKGGTVVKCLFVVMGCTVALVMLGGCNANEQRLNAAELVASGGAASLNTARWDGDVYTQTGPLQPGIAEIDDDGGSYQTGGPFSTLSARAQNGTLFFGAGSDYKIGKLTTSVETEANTTTMAAENVEVNNSGPLLAAAETAKLLYPTLVSLSKDEASVKIKQWETVGNITSTTAGLLRAWLGVP